MARRQQALCSGCHAAGRAVIEKLWAGGGLRRVKRRGRGNNRGDHDLGPVDGEPGEEGEVVTVQGLGCLSLGARNRAQPEFSGACFLGQSQIDGPLSHRARVASCLFDGERSGVPGEGSHPLLLQKYGAERRMMLGLPYAPPSPHHPPTFGCHALHSHCKNSRSFYHSLCAYSFTARFWTSSWQLLVAG